jgi:cytochrome c oxidase assembly protein subunit 11
VGERAGAGLPKQTLTQKNSRTAAIFALVALFMVGLAFASAPLYRVFCQATGFDGTTRKSIGGKAPGAVGKIVNVRFDANTSSALPWSFEPEKHVEKTAIGARKMAFFLAKNFSDQPVTGTATFNVTPTQAGKYFTKIQCFCFTEQTLKPGQEVRMPVVYYVDPAILDDPNANDISEITLSYTFYRVDEPRL